MLLQTFFREPKKSSRQNGRFHKEHTSGFANTPRSGHHRSTCLQTISITELIGTSHRVRTQTLGKPLERCLLRCSPLELHLFAAEDVQRPSNCSKVRTEPSIIAHEPLKGLHLRSAPGVFQSFNADILAGSVAIPCWLTTWPK